jgi:regulator of sigma E protease
MDSIREIASYFGTAANFLIIITVLVFVHELGHYWFARMCGMDVEAFAVMMGGIRETDLEQHLPKKLIPSRIVWTIYVLSFLAMLFGSAEKSYPLTLIGLFMVGTVVPIWSTTRIATLYQMSLGEAARQIAIPVLGALVLLMVSSRGVGALVPHAVLIAILGGSHLGLLLLYYKPVLGKPEGSKMGEGLLKPNGVDLPVKFKPVWAKTNKEGTEFSLLALPLGGFAAIKGMHPKEDGSEIHIDRGFYSRPPFQRFLVLFAGPAFSILLGVVLFFISFAVYGDRELSTDPVIGRMSEDGAAAKALLKVNDRITGINSKPVSTFFDVVSTVRSSEGKPVEITVDRNGKSIDFTLVPTLDKEASPVLGADMKPTNDPDRRQYKLGIAPTTKMVPLPIGEAFNRAMSVPGLAGAQFLKLLTSPQTAGGSVSGPGGIAQATHEAGAQGMQSLLQLAAGLSISLGFLNLLPIPPLDGGQMVVAVAEMFRRGRRLSIQVQHTLSSIGFFLIIALMLFAWTSDASRMFNR